MNNTNYDFSLRVAMNAGNLDAERAINAQIATALATQRVAEALEENNRLIKLSMAAQGFAVNSDSCQENR
jgi:hypothetical protein